MRDVIFHNIRNPDWWFTIIFIGLVIGLFANILKDIVYSIIANLSSRYSKYRAIKLELHTRYIDLLAQHPPLLIIEHIRMVYTGLLTVASFILYFLTPAMASGIQHLFVSDEHIQSLPIRIIQTTGIFMSPLFGILAIALEIRLLSRFRMCTRARRKYRNILTTKDVQHAPPEGRGEAPRP